MSHWVRSLSWKRIATSVIFLQFSCMFYFHLSILVPHYLNVSFQRWICCRYCRIPSLIDLGCLPISFGMLAFYLYKIGLYPLNCHTWTPPLLPFLEQEIGRSSVPLSLSENCISIKIFSYIYAPWNSMLYICSFHLGPFWIYSWQSLKIVHLILIHDQILFF